METYIEMYRNYPTPPTP